MSNPFVLKMDRFASLSSEDRHNLELAVERTYSLGSHRDIIAEGSNPNAVNVVLQGWACRYKMLADGRRQIISLLLPGDMCDPYVFLLPAVAHPLITLTLVTLGKMPGPIIRSMVERSPALAEALNWEMLTSAAISANGPLASAGARLWSALLTCSVRFLSACKP